MMMGNKLIWLVAHVTAAPPPPTEIVVGQVIASEIGQVINGWTDLGGGLYPSRSTANGVTTEVMECCYSILQKGDEFLVARTRALAKNDRGGVLAERVTGIMKLKRSPTEVHLGDCNILWIWPSLNLYDEKTKVVRSVVLTREDFVTLTWIDTGNFCDLGD